MRRNFYNQGQSLIGIIIVLIVVGLVTGGFYFYLSKQIPEVPKITENLSEEIITSTSTPSPTPSPSPSSSPNPSPSQSPTTITPAIVINKCQEITNSGSYVLGVDVQEDSSGPCINIHDAVNVQLDCFGKSISGLISISLKNISDFSINSCNLVSSSPQSSYEYSLMISNSQKGQITNSVIGGLKMDHSSNIIINKNSFNKVYTQKYSNYITITNNKFDNITMSAVYFALLLGSNNKVIGNNFDGRSKGFIQTPDGADNGINLGDESDDIIQDNIISNQYCTGIETTGKITNTLISGNVINNAGNAGIGAWYWNSWAGNTVSNNIVNNAPELFLFERTYGFRPQGWDYEEAPADEGIVYFKNNNFIDNNFNARPQGTGDYYSRASAVFDITAPAMVGAIPGEILPTSSQIIVDNNLIKNNDFGYILPAPFFYPYSMIIDGGENKCLFKDDPKYPIKCQ